MKSLLIQLLLLFVIIGSAFAQSLEKLQDGFDSRRQQAAELRDDQLRKLNTSYTTAVERLLEKIKGSGSLDAVLPVHKEIEALKDKADTLPDIPEKAPVELKQLRAKYEESQDKILRTHAASLVDLADKMNVALEKQETDFTKAGNIKEAVTVRELRGDIATDEEIIAARASLKLGAPESGGRARAEWRLLFAEKATVVTQVARKVAVLAEIQPDHNPLEPFVTALKGLPTKPQRVLMSAAPAVVQYELKERATRVRGKAHLANPAGSVRFAIEADGKQVFEGVIQRKVDSIPFEVEFAASKSIRLIVDPLPDGVHNWSAWFDLEVR